MELDWNQIYGIILSIIAVIGGAIFIPGWFVDRMQKMLTMLDNIILKINPQNEEQRKMMMDARAFIDCVYTSIADKKITVFEIKDIVDKANVLVKDIQNYHIPIPAVAPASDPTVMAMIQALRDEITALKQSPPKVV